MLSCHFVACPGLDGRILPVRIVDLELDKFHLRMGGQDFVQFFRCGVEGKSCVFDQSFLLFLLNPVPHVKIVEVFGPGLAQIVEQIEVEIAGAGFFQGSIKLCYCLFSGFAVDPCRIFGGELVTVSRIPLHQSLPDRFFTAGVSPCGIKISESRIQEQIHHLFYLFHIDFFVFLWKPHKSEAKFFNILTQICHSCVSFLAPARGADLFSLIVALSSIIV